jgi:hypothetical protein
MVYGIDGNFRIKRNLESATCGSSEAVAGSIQSLHAAPLP